MVFKRKLIAIVVVSIFDDIRTSVSKRSSRKSYLVEHATSLSLYISIELNTACLPNLEHCFLPDLGQVAIHVLGVG